jgi:hypothetical protein
MGDTYTTKATIFGLNTNGSIDSLDNGKGFMGANTRDPSLQGVSIPIDAFKQLYGSVNAGKQAIQKYGSPQFEVTNPKTGLTILAPLADLGPSVGQQQKGIGLDLTYGASKALGGTGLDTMQYKVASAPGSVGSILAGQFGTQGKEPELQTGGDNNVKLTEAYTPTSQPKPQATGGVNPSSGQLVQGAQAGPMQRSSSGGTSMNPIAQVAQTALTGGANAGTAIVQALPLVNQLAQGIAGRDTTSGLGKVGGSIRNVFEGDVGSGNPNTPWPTIQESIASIFNTPQADTQIADNSTQTGSSSGNGTLGGAFNSIKSFFGNNGSSGSTGPTGDNVDTSRYG